MKNKLKSFWYQYGGWFLLLGVPLVVVSIGVTAGQAHKDYASIPRTEAVPPAESTVTFDMETNKTYTAEDGVVVIPTTPRPGEPQAKPVEHLPDSDRVWEDATFLSTQGYTLPEDAALPDGSMGLLTIPKLGVSAPVYETEEGSEMESMTKGVAHFAVTSAWDGNIGFASHNVAHQLAEGDIVRYKTALGERKYKVSEVKEIADDDWSFLSRTDDNRLTLITCITGKPNTRLMVQALEA